MYALIRLKHDGAHGCRGYTLYGVCGNRCLLERVRAGQEHPEHWRVIHTSCELTRPGPQPLLEAG